MRSGGMEAKKDRRPPAAVRDFLREPPSADHVSNPPPTSPKSPLSVAKEGFFISILPLHKRANVILNLVKIIISNKLKTSILTHSSADMFALKNPTNKNTDT
jgi:hypothetical protein